MTYVPPDIVTDETAIAEQSLAGIADRIDGWEPAEGHIETPLAESLAVATATAAQAVVDQHKDAYQGFGERILRLPRIAAGVATAVSTWTVDAGALTEIPAGSIVDATLPGGALEQFVVATTVPVAAAVMTVTGVVLAALDAGPDANGATNPASSPLIGVVAVSIDAPAAGGLDEEDPDAYVDRLADRARRLKITPITPEDYAAVALDVALVARAVAFNRLNPPSTSDAPGHMALFPLDAAGHGLSTGDRGTVAAYFASIERPLNVTLHVVAPATVNITVAVTVRAAAGAVSSDVQAQVQAAVAAALDPANFDRDDDQPGHYAAPTARTTFLTVFDIAAAVDDLDVVAAVTAVTINGATTPVALPAPLSLPNLTVPATVTVT